MAYENDIPDYALIPAKETENRVIVPITKGAIYSPVQVTNIRKIPKTTITVEEDILVPDTKADLKDILLIDGKSYLTGRETEQIVSGDDYINVSGEIEFQTLYLPERAADNTSVIPVQSRIPFKEQWHISSPPGSTLVIDCSIEKIDCMVVNERKYRVKAALALTALEYTETNLDVFEGLSGEEIQVLKETVELSNVALRKKDIISVKEDFLPPEGIIPTNILKQDINVVENYKQSTGDKVVINGFIYANALYSAVSDDDSPEADSLHRLSERVEFTQFVPIQQNGQWSGCNVFFNSQDLRLKLTQDDELQDVFRLAGDVLTHIELYKNVEKDVIVDGYHNEKDFVCDVLSQDCCTLTGTVASEASVREIVSADAAGHEIGKVLYCNADVLSSESKSERGKITTEGMLNATMICSVQDEDNVFSLRQEVPFRVVTAMPSAMGNEFICHKVYIKDLWSEKINGKQLEFNVTVLVCGEILRPTPFRALVNPAFEESDAQPETPPMVIYICKPSDTLWHIAKRFKTSPDSVRQTNALESDSINTGQKLLIVK